MQLKLLRRQAYVFVTGVAILAFSGWASADPPSRVARLGYMAGAVSFSPAGESDWVEAAINRPLTTGDRLWADAGARAEVQLGGAMIRMNANTGVSVLNLDDRTTQLQLTQGTLNVRVRRLEPNQVFEVDTPNLAFTLRQPGEYRIDVEPDGNATTIIVRKGQGEVYGEGAAYVIDTRQSYRFSGTGLREYQYVAAPRLDEFDHWASGRDNRYDNSGSARYVSPDVVGYQDLDANGTWRVDPDYGNVWVPNRVARGWTPYRDGHWAWVDPWGWTWVDDAPWGFAVSHYGRWANLGETWGWVPGPVRSRAYYAPALVMFVGGNNFQLTTSGGNVGGVAWFPLGPRDVYRPAYPVSRGYYENINRSNTVINNTVINNTYNNTNITNVIYANRQVPGAVVAVPTTAFAQSRPVSKAAVRVSPEVMVSAPIGVVAPVAPTEKSIRGAAVQSGKPPARAFERPVVAYTAPPTVHTGFAAQQPQLTAKPGMPLDDTARKELKAVAAAPAPVVKVVGQTQVTPLALPPPSLAPGARQADSRGKPDERKVPTMPLQATPPPEQRGKSEQHGKEEQRGASREQAVVPPSLPQQRVVQTPAIPLQVAPPPEQRGKREQRGPAIALPPPTPMPTPTQPPAQPKLAPSPEIALPAPAAQQPARPRPPEPIPAAKQAEPRPPVAAPVSVPPPPPSQSLPKAEPREQERKPADARRTKPEPTPAAKPTEPGPPVAAPIPAPSQAAPKPEPHGQERKPGDAKLKDKKKDGDEQDQEEGKRRQDR